MAIAHVGAGTVLHATSLPSASAVKSDIFADSKNARGTVVTCWCDGADGTLRIYKIMKHTGEEIEIEIPGGNTVTAGAANARFIDIDFPVGRGRCTFASSSFGSVTRVEIEMRSKGR